MRDRVQAALAAAALFVLNAYVCRELFTTEYTAHMGSIEGAYIGLSRYWLEHGWPGAWFSAWYGGVPFQNTYPPLLHALVAGVAWLSGMSPAQSHHAVTAVLYCSAPVSLYALGRGLGAGNLASFGAGLLYSLYSPASALSPTVHSWAGASWRPSRLQSLVTYGDGPHVSSVALLPWALLALHAALNRRGPWRTALAALTMIAVVLTNWLGALALALAAISYLLARSDEPHWVRLCARAVCIAAGAYLLAAPWIPPSTIGDIQRNAQFVGGPYPMTARHVLYWAAMAAAVALLRWLLVRIRASPAVRFAAFFLLFAGGIVLLNDWPGIYLVPQPNRYHLELEMAVCALVSFALLPLLAGRRWRRALAVFAVMLACLQVYNYRKIAGPLIRPIDIRQTLEYQAGQWLQQNLPGGRVFLTGSTQFWLNAFAATAQVGGGFAQGVVNTTIPIVHYGLPYVTQEGAKMAMWLRLYGVDAVAVSGSGGRDSYRYAWRDPKQFDGALPEAWREGDDVIYRVPRRSASLAHVIRKEHVVLRTSVNVLDVEPVTPLAAALEDTSLPLARFEWMGADRARITAEAMTPEHFVFVQVSYHPGWRARSAGRDVAIARDGLGFMVLAPSCQGSCEVTLRFDGGGEMTLARAGSAGVTAAWLLWAVLGRRGSDKLRDS